MIEKYSTLALIQMVKIMMIRYLLAILLFVYPHPTLAENEPCTLDESLCKAIAEYDLTDKSLNVTYKNLIRAIESGKFDHSHVDKKSIKSTLVDAQRKWITYRDSNCDALYTLLSGGTSRNYYHLECLTKMTKERTQYLKNTYEY